jgi:hypothetical protein
VLGAYKGYQNYYIDSKQIYNGSKYVGKIDGLHIVDNSGETVGYVTSNGWAVSTTGEAIGKLDDVGNVIKGAESLIPATGKITGSTGRVKYTINAANQVIDKTGAVVGSINDAGQIYTSSNTLLGMVDDSGTLLSGLQKTINAGYKVDFAGQIINKTITKTTTIGEQIYEQIYYLDDAGNKIGQLMTTKDSGKTISYVTKFVDPSTVKVNGEIPKSGLEKVVGQIDDTGSLVTEWNKFFQVERSTGVKRAWQQEKALVKATGKGTYKTWTEQQISELLAKGKVSGYQGHHICSALYSPQLAANPDNIAFYSAIEHLQIAHQGNYQTITFGTLLSRAIPAMAIAA